MQHDNDESRAGCTGLERNLARYKNGDERSFISEELVKEFK
jgi:hypothetical protein